MLVYSFTTHKLWERTSCQVGEACSTPSANSLSACYPLGLAVDIRDWSLRGVYSLVAEVGRELEICIEGDQLVYSK
jgi:hypothetical protein